MALTKVSEGIASVVAEPTDYHKELVAGGKLWAFNLKYVDQKTFNWGHRIVYQGGYAVSYDLERKVLEKVEYPAISTEENLDELVFVHNDNIYLLLHTAFGAVDLKKFYLWKENHFVEVPFEGPESESTSLEIRTWFKKADGVASNGNIVFLGNSGNSIRVFSVSLNENSATGTFVAVIANDNNPLGGTATSGFVNGDNVAIGYGVHGCGYRWEKCSFLTINLATKEIGMFNVEGEHKPEFCFSGAHFTTLLPNGHWAHVAGSVQVGMCDSRYVGTAWILRDPFGIPGWMKLAVELPEGAFISGNNIYLINKDQVAIGKL